MPWTLEKEPGTQRGAEGARAASSSSAPAAAASAEGGVILAGGARLSGRGLGKLPCLGLG